MKPSDNAPAVPSNVIVFPKGIAVQIIGTKETKTVLPSTRCFIDYNIRLRKSARSRTLEQLHKEQFTKEQTIGQVAKNGNNRYCWMRLSEKDDKGKDQETWVASFVLEPTA